MENPQINPDDNINPTPNNNPAEQPATNNVGPLDNFAPAPVTPIVSKNVPIEVYPDAAQGGVGAIPLSPPRNAIDAWFLRNLAPLLIVFVSITLQIASDVIPRGKHSAKPSKAPTTDVIKEADKPEDSPATAPAPRPISEEQVLSLVAPLLWLGLLLTVTAILVPAARTWIIGVLKNIAIRPLPALRFMDLVAIVFVWLTAARLLAIMFLGRFPLNSGEERALELLINGAGLLFSVMSAVFLARHRAGSTQGSNGIWPFWSLWKANPQRSILIDVIIGVVCYPISLLLVGICLYVNQKAIDVIGHGRDQHPLIGDLSQHQSVAVLVVYFLMATAAAAIFEEIIFRGVLYNVMRRYFGSFAGAVGAAAIFAVIHFVWSQVLGLFVLALILTWLYDRTGRLVAGITLHAVNNFVTLMITLFLSKGGGS